MKISHHTYHKRIITTFLLLIFYQPIIAQRNNIIFESTFDSSNSINKWSEKSLFNAWSGKIVKDNVRGGAGSFKVQLIRGLDTAYGPRAELGLSAQKTQSEFWYGFSNFFANDYLADPATEIVSQWQAQPDFQLGEAWRSPPLALEINNDRFKIAIRWCVDKVSTAQATNIAYLDIGPVTHARWIDWVFHVKWRYDNSGILQIWKNGTLILERLNKPIGYNDVFYPYFKIGIYKWEWKLANTISTSYNRSFYIDEVRIGNNLATYRDVIPKPTVYPTLPINLNITKTNDESFAASFIASATMPTKENILYISEDSGRTLYPTFSESILKLTEEKSYTLKFKPKIKKLLLTINNYWLFSCKKRRIARTYTRKIIYGDMVQVNLSGDTLR